MGESVKLERGCMSREFANNLSSFGDEIEDFRRAFQELKKQLEEMKTKMRSLKDGVYEGESSEQLMSRFEWDVKMAEEMIDYQDKLLGCLGYAKDEYEKCENKVTGIIDAIKV